MLVCFYAAHPVGRIVLRLSVCPSVCVLHVCSYIKNKKF